MAAAAPLIADPIVRNRGTLVGSLCHADPQGDWASVVTALGGHVVAQGAGGRRTIKITDFVTGPFQNTLDYDEIAVEAVIPAAQGTLAGGYLKLERRVGDFATAGVAVVGRPGRRPGGPRRHRADRGRQLDHRGQEAADALVGGSLDEAGIGRAADLAADAAQPNSRPPRQRRLQAAHRAHVRHPDPDPGRRRSGEGSMTSLFDEITAAAPDDAVPVRRVTITRQRRTAYRRHRAAAAARAPAAPGAPAHRHPHRLRHHQLRRLHRARGRHPGEELHDARRPGRRPRGHHRRGARYGRASWTRSRRGSRRSTASSAASARRG